MSTPRPLLTVHDVMALTRLSERKVRALKIPVVRICRRRLYDPRDVERFLREAVECPSTNEKTRRTGGRSSSSKGVGLLAALAAHPVETQSNSSEPCEIRLPERSERRGRQAKPSMRLVASTGLNTEKD